MSTANTLIDQQQVTGLPMNFLWRLGTPGCKQTPQTLMSHDVGEEARSKATHVYLWQTSIQAEAITQELGVQAGWVLFALDPRSQGGTWINKEGRSIIRIGDGVMRLMKASTDEAYDYALADLYHEFGIWERPQNGYGFFRDEKLAANLVERVQRTLYPVDVALGATVQLKLRKDGTGRIVLESARMAEGHYRDGRELAEHLFHEQEAIDQDVMEDAFAD